MAVALVQFRALVGELVEHWERLRGVRHAWDHLTHARLELYDFILQLFVVCFELIPFFARCRKLRRHDLELVLRVLKFLLQFTQLL